LEFFKGKGFEHGIRQGQRVLGLKLFRGKGVFIINFMVGGYDFKLNTIDFTIDFTPPLLPKKTTHK
jgi:hypothetical protein